MNDDFPRQSACLRMKSCARSQEIQSELIHEKRAGASLAADRLFVRVGDLLLAPPEPGPGKIINNIVYKIMIIITLPTN